MLLHVTGCIIFDCISDKAQTILLFNRNNIKNLCSLINHLFSIIYNM